MQLIEAYRAKSQPLAEDYARHEAGASSRFDYSFDSQEDWGKRADWVMNGDYSRLNRNQLVRVLKLYNEEISNSEHAAVQSLERLNDSQALVVVGGQQAGLFTGPLLVIHKAVSIIRLAREAAERLRRPVIPVFWIAGEDHDFDEVSHCYALSGSIGVERWKLDHPSGIRTSISRLDIPSWADALAKMDEWLAPSDFKPEIMEHLNLFAVQSRSLTDYFARVMAWLFGRHGLILMDSDDLRLRKLEAPMFGQLLDRHQEINQLLLEGAEKVRSLGYTPLADQAEGNVNLFYFDDKGERILLQHSGELFTDRKMSFRLEEADLRKLIVDRPEKFSNNVMTRPMMQDYLLPVLAVVLGPGEIAYWALTREAFHGVGMRMPIVAPRLEFTLIEGTVRKHMEKFELNYDTVMDRFEEYRVNWLSGQGQQEVEELFAETKRKFEELYRPVLETVSALNPGLAKLGDTNRQKIVEQIDFLRLKAIDALENKFSSGLRQLDRIGSSLAPLSKPQERVYNVFAYLNKYGRDWVDGLIQESYPYDGQHRLAYL